MNRTLMPHYGVLASIWLLTIPCLAWAQVDQQRADTYFKEAAVLCEREGGRLWGVSLCGPMVFADAATRSIATNQPTPTANRPPQLGFMQAPIEWAGTRWAAYVWAMVPTDDPQARARLMIHELFHRVQPELGLMTLGKVNSHLDTLEGRYWMQLEWRALARALGASESDRLLAAREALAFRSARRALFADAAENERADEIREGLAQYTGTVVSTASGAEAIADATRQLADAEKAPTFVRTFGYASGTAYGILLDGWSPGWTRRLKPTDDLGQLVADAARIQPLTGDVGAVAARYGAAELMAREAARDAERKVRIQEVRRRFVEGPVLMVPRGRGAVLRTTGATPIPEGTVYFEYRVTAEWGALVSTGVLESSDGVTLRLPAPFRADGASLAGDGWTLTLAPGWVVEPGSRPGDFQVVHKGG